MAKESAPPVIQLVESAQETATQRLIRKQIPAWVVSGVVHVALIGGVIAFDLLRPPSAPIAASDEQLPALVDPEEQPEVEKNLINEDIGFDADLPSVTVSEQEDTVTVADKTAATETPGIESATLTTPMTFNPPSSLGSDLGPAGAVGDFGTMMTGTGLGGDGNMADAFRGRGGASKSRMLAMGGGNEKSEAAVARGLAWLAKQQKGNGSWAFDKSGHGTAATGLCLLPFLAAGQTHKVSKDNKYNRTVEMGLRHLISIQKKDGSFPGNMYDQAIATIALCEALGMTGDRSLLQVPAQKAVNYIQSAQGPDGGWRYGFQAPQGDTSVVGWQIQALHSAKLCKELVVDKKVFDNARKFLDKVSSGSNKSKYGYTGQNGSLSMTAVGLLCRYYMDGWGPNHPGLATGVSNLLAQHLPGKGRADIYYYYYATQVVHFYEGPEWHRDWNPKMRDLLIDTQLGPDKGPNAGSWDPDTTHTGQVTGRLGTTALSLLILEVYYRHLPLYKRDNAGLKELERVK